MAPIKSEVITGKVRLSYPKLFTPEANDRGQLKYSCAILIPKSDTETYEKLLKAEARAEAEGKKGKWGGKGKTKDSVIKDGDARADDYPERAGHWMMSITSDRAPGVVGPDLQDIIDPSELYAGCWVRVGLNAYPYDFQNNRGVGFGLNNVQKIADGEPLGGVPASAQDDFSAIEDDSELI